MLKLKSVATAKNNKPNTKQQMMKNNIDAKINEMETKITVNSQINN